MSCHDIGRGMNSVVETVLAEYDAGHIDLNVAKRIISSAKKGVNYCDGNESEAIKCFEEQMRCGRCLKSMRGDSCLCHYMDDDESVLAPQICLKCLTEMLDKM